MNFPSPEAQMTIFSQILSGHLKQHLFSAQIQSSASAVIQAAITLHDKMVHSFLPTAIKFHYTFNLRDLCNVFQVMLITSNLHAVFPTGLQNEKWNILFNICVIQGIFFAGPESVTNGTDLALLWIHESCRVYSDRLVDVKDLQLFRKLQMETVHECFEV